ncbi:hypothetical protein C8J57DRAFT_1118178, partial [Mycena rebaudengoi]
MTETGEKRKRPPSFQHFPINRAKKLKQAWVQNTKLKSKWKAEKRKNGLMPARNEGEEDPVEDSEVTESKDDVQPPAQARIAHTKKPSRTQHPRREAEAGPSTATEPTLRDRAREAYSQTSLHTYKSDPQRRRKGEAGTGRGQPDMKKRMSILLETIKRDF